MPDTIFDWLKRNDISFSDRGMIMEALTHSSYVNEHKGNLHDNERLEFMGDAVLQVWTSRKLIMLDPPLSEGQMTTLRSQLVCEAALAHYSRELGWGAYLLLGVGEERTGGRDRDSLLADMFEAMLGALYLDHGMKPDTICHRRLISPTLPQERTVMYMGSALHCMRCSVADPFWQLRAESASAKNIIKRSLRSCSILMIRSLREKTLRSVGRSH